MIVNYHVVQKNEFGSGKLKFLFQVKQEWVSTGTEIEFKRKRFQIIWIQLFKKCVNAICYQIKGQD